MIFILAAMAAYGLWRVTVVMRTQVADRTTGAILLVITPLTALPVVLLAMFGEERGIHTPMWQAMTAGGLGLACLLLGVVLLIAGKKKASEQSGDDWGLRAESREKAPD